jgi:hypothetical protein
MRGDRERQGEDVVAKCLIQAVFPASRDMYFFLHSFPRKRESTFALGPRIRGDERDLGFPLETKKVDNAIETTRQSCAALALQT